MRYLVPFDHRRRPGTRGDVITVRLLLHMTIIASRRTLRRTSASRLPLSTLKLHFDGGHHRGGGGGLKARRRVRMRPPPRPLRIQSSNCLHSWATPLPSSHLPRDPNRIQNGGNID